MRIILSKLASQGVDVHIEKDAKGRPEAIEMHGSFSLTDEAMSAMSKFCKELGLKEGDGEELIAVAADLTIIRAIRSSS